MNECRNCGIEESRDLGFVGEVAPFFLKRVLNLEYGLAPSGHPVKKILRNIRFVSKAFQKIYAKSVLVEMQICERCSFIQTKRPFSEAAIGNLYLDYRSNSYNQERIRYEPEYAAIAPHLGGCAQEIETRKVGLTQWLQGKVSPGRNFSMLDYGGADGMFLPDLPGRKYVFDISDITPANGITRVKNESDLGSYSISNSRIILNMCLGPFLLPGRLRHSLKIRATFTSRFHRTSMTLPGDAWKVQMAQHVCRFMNISTSTVCVRWRSYCDQQVYRQ